MLTPRIQAMVLALRRLDEAGPRILSAGLSDVGLRRANNQDSYLVDDEMKLYVVADGMGGHRGGELASSIAVQTIDALVRLQKPTLDQHRVWQGSPAQHPARQVLSSAVRGASAAIFRRAQDQTAFSGMGTTVTGVMFAGPYAVIAHVGDSRAYRIRNGEITQLSDDHSLVAEQLRAGVLTSTEALRSRFKNVITRSVGFELDVEVDTRVDRVEEGDHYVLCSDGLVHDVAPDEIRDIVSSQFLQEGARKLVALANERGGADNVTVVALYVSGVDPRAEPQN